MNRVEILPMPYRWTRDPLAGNGLLAELRLWPHRSLSTRGFVGFIAVTATLLLLPLVALIGSAVLWGVLPFILIAIWGVWAAIRRSDRDLSKSEVLRLWPDRMTLLRRDPDGSEKHWEANPYWVGVRLHPTGGPVPNYLTLKGADREVEIGAFLSEDERLALKPEIEAEIARSRRP